MPVVVIANVRIQAINLLLANRLAPNTDAVGGNSRYPVLAEFTSTILRVDGILVQARISNRDDPYRPSFMSVTANLADGDFIPGHIGVDGEIIIDPTGGGTFQPALMAKDRDEVEEMKAYPALYPTKLWGVIEGGQVFHNGSAARVRYPAYTKTGACQAPEVDELAEILGTVGMLPKDGSVTPELYSNCANYFIAYEQRLRGVEVPLPEIQQIKRQLEMAA